MRVRVGTGHRIAGAVAGGKPADRRPSSLLRRSGAAESDNDGIALTSRRADMPWCNMPPARADAGAQA